MHSSYLPIDVRPLMAESMQQQRPRKQMLQTPCRNTCRFLDAAVEGVRPCPIAQLVEQGPRDAVQQEGVGLVAGEAHEVAKHPEEPVRTQLVDPLP